MSPRSIWACAMGSFRQARTKSASNCVWRARTHGV